MKKFKPELKHFALDFTLPFMREFFNTEYLHYGYWEAGVEVNFSNIKKAQQKYVDFLVEHIPEGVEEILDVGSGTGEIAKNLVERNYRVDCISPSEPLNELAREKLGNRSQVFTESFENFTTQKKYDLILFSESFQYIPLAASSKNSETLLKDKGFILIADFFRNQIEEKSPIGGGHSLKKFYDSLQTSSFEMFKDIDITEFTAPTIDLRKRFIHNLVMPVSQSSKLYLSEKYSTASKLLFWLMRKKVDKFKAKYVKRKVDAEAFKKFKSYRLFLLRKK